MSEYGSMQWAKTRASSSLPRLRIGTPRVTARTEKLHECLREATVKRRFVLLRMKPEAFAQISTLKRLGAQGATFEIESIQRFARALEALRWMGSEEERTLLVAFPSTVKLQEVARELASGLEHFEVA